LTEKPADPKTILTMLRMCNPTLPTADWRVAKVEEAEGLRRQVVLTLNEETVKALERTEHRLKYGFEHVSVRIYKSDAKAKPGAIELEADTQEPDLEEPTEEKHPEGMSDEEEDILEGYTSEESDLARALSGLLRAALMEAEAIVNSRPLTYIPLEDENEESLTPNHFLLGSSTGRGPTMEPLPEGVQLNKSWMESQQLADSFWRRWLQEYLPVITRRAKWCEKAKPLVEGDIVYVCDPGQPRSQWPKGRI
ncbi:hypothetical protein KR074_011603, partial [Drosophila pseudoananassae]